MIHPWKQYAAQYAIRYKDKEYVFYIKRDGSGVCLCQQDAWDTIFRKDQDRLVTLFDVLALPDGQNRAEGIEEEFSCNVQLSSEVTSKIWLAWEKTNPDNPESETPEAVQEVSLLSEWLDGALLPILEANFAD